MQYAYVNEFLILFMPKKLGLVRILCWAQNECELKYDVYLSHDSLLFWLNVFALFITDYHIEISNDNT